MPNCHPQGVDRIRAANERLWQERVSPLLTALDESGRIVLRTDWERILAFAFDRSIEVFHAVQLLCHPDNRADYWVSGLVLTRSNYETFVTLEWIVQDTEARVRLFLDEDILMAAHFVDHIPEEHLGLVRPESREEITRRRAEVLDRRQLGAGRLRVLPSIEERVRTITPTLHHVYPDLLWEYEVYYRDVSGFSHPSAWGMISFFDPPPRGPIRIETPPDVGRRALLSNGEWFLRILNRWNTVFEGVPSATLTEWQGEWAAAIRDRQRVPGPQADRPEG